MGRTRRKNQSKCMSISPFAIEKTPFKDKPGNEINFDDCINPKPPHILMRSPLKLLKGNGLQQVLKNILDTDVGVDRKYLLNQVLDRETNYQTLLIELKKLLKQNSRLYLYIHLSQERVKSEGANEEIYPRKVVLQVLHFIVSHVGLPSLLGSKQNFKLFMKLVKKVVYGSHHQKFGLSSMVHGFKVSHILWLQQSLRSNSLRLNVLACLVKWLLCYVQNIVYKIWCLVPLSSKELVFYDRIKWQARKKIEIDAIIQRESIRPIENRELKDKVRHIGRTRFIIKPNGDLRPITKFMKASNPADITLRQNARMLVSQFAHFSGSTNTIFGPQIDRLLQDSLVKLLSCQPSFRRPPYYFVKADVKDAYGSIHHVTLVEMMNTVLETVGELEMRNVKMGRKSCIMFESPRLVIPSTVTKGSKVENSECQIQPICTHIEEFFAYSATKIDGQLYRIRHGIPQGMYLSAALCELYYSCLDSKYFGDFRNSKRDELFIRYCDDYLFLTPCKERAEKFLITCVTGFEHVTFNNAKLLTNLNETGISFVPFCGYTIDINTFQIQSNFLSYKNTNIVHSFDLTKTKNPGRLILSRMRIVLKLHLSLLDQRINGKFVALKNVYKASLLFAFRFYAYVNCYVPVGRLNQKFLIECIKRGLWVIKSKVLRAVARNEALRGVTKPTSKDAEWLLREEIKLVALKAFIARILKGGGVHQYPNILKYLKVTCSRIISKLKPDQLKLIETVTNPPLPETFNTMKW